MNAISCDKNESNDLVGEEKTFLALRARDDQRERADRANQPIEPVIQIPEGRGEIGDPGILKDIDD